MGCYKPIAAYLSTVPKSNGKKAVSFRPSNTNELTHLPCGQCIGCRLERSRQWAMRGVNEKAFHEESMFLTLTINPEHMKKRNHDGLEKRELQLFMKRLRKHVREEQIKNNEEKRNIRFLACGEYGPTKNRPHYHVIVFGYEFKDKKIWKYSKPNKFVSLTKKFPLYRSEDLEKLWTLGYSSIGDATFETIAYVARYILKKINGDKDRSEMPYVDKETGLIKEKEYIVMSRRPGIGKKWLEQYEQDLYPKDWVMIRGKKMRPPRYYDKIMEIEKPEMFRKVKTKRIEAARKKADEDFAKPLDQRAPKLETQEYVKTRNQKNQTRSYEDET